MARAEDVKVKPRSKRAKRIMEKREPKLVEEVKTVLLLHGNKTSQVTKDVLTDIHRLKFREALKLSRKNDDMKPFEPGGETHLEHLARKADCGMFVLDSHTKKRPHNLILGRFFDHRVYDLLELGVDKYRAIREFAAAAASVQAGNKPCFAFVGEQFESDPDFRLAKSMLLDLFRGRLVESINLKGVDHVIFVAAMDRKLLLRPYAIRFKKSGTKIPRVELAEMGPEMDLSIRRTRPAAADLEKEAMKRALIHKKKEKNVSRDNLEGKVGRMYVPRQEVETMPLRKMKGLKRDRRETAVAAKAEKKQRSEGAPTPVSV
ncbi:Brix-domain-containing protein [Coccomyxa subellipsoidea C-169]|uniref:Ribosome production factor 2 homolog n=1 Tax=Coccomyxa subellipsoidea (strain C-169) TaxID=574566 RepID=I0Z1A0_COCSC|nr:Brix-domain-containing protein [Coccomyxa subellipsoidea C-169]EIE24419.1 Brix-domain-containing protein [Coccomyxa subellipsoidea C-169]|eukprot:XP_005648963.1 Brix-domain-containing protein [Coccomyxa subellipsoidea C-169]